MQRKRHQSPFSGYSAYVAKLGRLSEESPLAVDWDARVNAALDGQASVELRRVAPLQTRRKFGTFFTGTRLASRLIECSIGFDARSVLYDPTCGMGDLLIAAARKLPIGKTLSETLQKWGHQLSGTDLHPEFISGTRTRLYLLALQRHKTNEKWECPSADLFPNIRVADGLKQEALFAKATHLLLNPPFGRVASPPECKWASGRTTEAATFVVSSLERAKPGAEMLAILPDVLRSGSFSEQWRKRVSELAEVKLVQPYGIFDHSADVDVFLLKLLRRTQSQSGVPRAWTQQVFHGSSILADFFDVHVGSVVPYRDAESGPLRRYIHPRNIDTWVEVNRISETRRHGGRVFLPPFLVLRRTSRPGDSYRAVATIIGGRQPVAIENHLIVCIPHDRSLDTCRTLLNQLRTQRVNEFLNHRIRCRHLTVNAVGALPFEPK